MCEDIGDVSNKSQVIIYIPPPLHRGPFGYCREGHIFRWALFYEQRNGGMRCAWCTWHFAICLGREGNDDSTGCSANYPQRDVHVMYRNATQYYPWAEHFCSISFFHQLINTPRTLGNSCVKMLIESMQGCHLTIPVSQILTHSSIQWWHGRKASVAHYDAVLEHLFDKEQIFIL